MLKRDDTNPEGVDNQPVKKRGRKKIEKAADLADVSAPQKAAEGLRDEKGLLRTIQYPLKPNGFIDWRRLIAVEHIALNRYVLANKGKSIEDFSQEEQKQMILDAADEEIVIKLSGFRELAEIRGYNEIKTELLQWTPENVSIKVTVSWIPNIENPNGLTVSAIANASLVNVDDTFARFLETIAENRAFIRAVRHSLGIISLGQEEFKQDDVKVEAQNIKIQSVLDQHLKSSGISLHDLQELTKLKGFVWNPKWTSVEKIDPAAAMTFIPLVKKIVE